MHAVLAPQRQLDACCMALALQLLGCSGQFTARGLRCASADRDACGLHAITQDCSSVHAVENTCSWQELDEQVQALWPKMEPSKPL